MIPFVDAHVHFWDLERITYPWLTPPFGHDGPNGSVAAIARNYLPSDYRADLARWNMVGAVHIDAGAEPSAALDETRWLSEQRDASGLPNAIVAFAPLHEPEVETVLVAQSRFPHVRGIRQIVNWHDDPSRTYTPRDITQDDQWQAGYGLLAKYGLSFDLQCYAGQMLGLAPLIARHPEIPVIINHVGMPVTNDREGVTLWREGMQTLASIPHVQVKLSGLGFMYRKWTLEDVRPFLLEAIDLFGTDRAMVASDAPTDTLFAPTDRSLATFHALFAEFSEDERRNLFGRNANRVYRLGLHL